MICKDVDWPRAPDTVFSRIAFDSWDAWCTLSLSVPAFHPAFLLPVPEADAYCCTDREGRGFPALPPQQSAPIHGSCGAPFPSGQAPTGKALPEPAVPWIAASSKSPCLLRDLPAPPLEAAARALQRALSTSALSDSAVTALTDQGVLVKELEEQTSEREFGWITAEQYPEIHISDST